MTTRHLNFEFFILVGLAVVAGVVLRTIGSQLWPGILASICVLGLATLGVKATNGMRSLLFIIAVVVAVTNLAILIPV